jgi:photosystem II stability/assembly factor-like uncharacterized protein
MAYQDTVRRPPCLFLIAALAASPLSATEAVLLGPAGRCLGLAGAGEGVVLEACAEDAADQRWQVPAAGFDGAMVGAGGFCLGVAETSGQSLPVQVAECDAGASQSWRLEDDGRIVGLGGKCLESAGDAEGAPASLAACHGGDSQIFRAVARHGWSRMPVLGPEAGYGLGRIFTSDEGRIVHLQTSIGLLRSADGGRSWSVSPGERHGYLDRNLILADRMTPDRLFAGSADGLLRSEDGGRSWLKVLASKALLRQSPIDGAHFFALTDDALFRSLDHGASFQRLAGLPADGLVSSGLTIAADGDLYLMRRAGCGSHHCGLDAALYRSADLGATWTLLREAQFEGAAFLLAHPTAAATLYWLRGEGQGFELFLERSDDDGATWSSTEIPGGNGLTAALIGPGQPDDLWLIQNGQVLRSRDRGASWQVETYHPDSEFGASSLVRAGDRILVFAERFGDDGPDDGAAIVAVRDGVGWTALPPLRFGLQEIFHVAAAARPGRYYASRYAVWRTDDSGRSWAKVRDRACPYALAADPLLPDMLYLGSSSCNFVGEEPVVYRSPDGGATLEPIGPPRDGATDAIRAFPWLGGAAVVVLSRDDVQGRATVLRSLDRFQTWSQVLLPGPATHLLVDADGVLFAYDPGPLSRLYRSFDAGLTWDQHFFLDTFFAAGARLLLAVDLTQGGLLQLSRDAGASWRLIPGPFAWGRPRAAAIDPLGRILLVDDQGRIVISPDEGRSWQTLAGDQPASWTGDLAFDPSEAGRILVGTGHGPYLAHFAPAAASPAPALALGDRFEARLQWRDGVGGAGEGHGTRLTDDTGLFWLFTPERAEIAVKLLDGRALNGRFWVFVAGLTHVELDLEIVDRLTGERRSHHNPLGQFSSFADTAAFPLGAATHSLPRASEPPTGPAAASTLVEVGGRFTVQVEWTDPAGQTGDGRGFPLAHDTAAFYFFSPSNVELLVNVVDGRPLNGHFWVFLGGLSNVAYRVTITDTTTGARKRYDNPAGSFASFGDTFAF